MYKKILNMVRIRFICFHVNIYTTRNNYIFISRNQYF